MVLPVEGETRVVSATTVDGEQFGAHARTTHEALDLLWKFIDEHAKGRKSLMYLRVDALLDGVKTETLIEDDRRPGFPERHIDHRSNRYYDRM